MFGLNDKPAGPRGGGFVQERSWLLLIAALVAGLTIWLAQPTVYGYYNGEPITSLAEAQYRAERVFANLAQAELPSEEELMQKLFLLNE